VDFSDSDRRKEIEGQARALRAMAHFDLLRFFGQHWDEDNADGQEDADTKLGIPVVDQVQKVGDVRARSTVSETYTFILDELTTALGLLNEGQRDPAFVNDATVRALLARVYLYQKDYVAAADYASQVIADGAFTLAEPADYATIFTDRQTSESIFELAFDGQNRSRFNGQTYSRFDAFNTEVNFLADSMLNEFFQGRPGDVRANLVDFDPENNPYIAPSTLGRTQKYRGEVNEDNPAYIIRLAEMYLIRAEANANLNGYSNLPGDGGPIPLQDLNTIRNKRGLASLLDGVDLTNETEFKYELLNEIRAEFNFEGHYFFDLARLELIESELNLEPHRAILPIPLRELTATKNAVNQNPEY
jgi:hypothetical protein